MTPDTLDQMADRFAGHLKDMMTDRQWENMRMMNALRKDGESCASHDYVDANVAMLTLLEKCGMTYDPQSDKQSAMMNEVWEIAKAKHLTDHDFIPTRDIIPFNKDFATIRQLKEGMELIEQLMDIEDKDMDNDAKYASLSAYLHHTRQKWAQDYRVNA